MLLTIRNSGQVVKGSQGKSIGAKEAPNDVNVSIGAL